MLLSLLVFSSLVRLPSVSYDKDRLVRNLRVYYTRENYVQSVFSKYRLTKPEFHPQLQKLKKGAFKNPKDQIVIRVLALRVEFQEEIPDDPRTTGNGLFRTTDNGQSPILGVDCEGRPFYNPNYDPPHDWTYFNNQMRALASYVYAATYGKVRLEWVVKPDSGLPPYKVPHPIIYYGDTSQMELGLVTFLRDAFRSADKDPTINFEDLDNNGIKDYQEGIWDRYIIFHAGSAWQTDVAFNSPFDLAAVTIPSGALEYYFGRGYLILNEGRDTVYDACILPETMSQDGLEVKLQGTLFHESGHNLFLLPDLYDVSGRGAGIGSFGIMTTGPYLDAVGIPSGLIPPMPNAWERLFMDYILRLIFGEGFLDERVVQEVNPTFNPQEITIYPLTAPVDSFTLHKTPSGLYYVSGNFLEDPYSKTRIVKIPINSKEYFLVQNLLTDYPANNFVSCNDTLKVMGYWSNGVVVDFRGENDYLLPGDGLLVFHVDDDIVWRNYASNTVNAVRPMGVYILEADHVQDFQEFNWDFYPYSYCWFGSPYDLYFKGNNDIISSTSNPASLDNFGNRTNIKIFQISPKGYQMSFKVVLEENLNPFPIRVGYTLIDSSASVMHVDEPSESFSEVKDSFIVVPQNILRKEIHISSLDTTVMDSFGLITVMKYSGDTVRIISHDTLWRERFINIPALYDIDSDGSPEFACVTNKRRLLLYSTNDANGDSKTDRIFNITLPEEVVGIPSIFEFGNKTYIGVGLYDNHYYFVDTTGQIAYRLDTGAPAHNIPATNGHILLYQSSDGRVIILTDRWQEYAVGIPNLRPTLLSPVFIQDSASSEPYLLTSSARGLLAIYDVSGNLKKSKTGFEDPKNGMAVGDIDGDGKIDFCYVTKEKLVAINSELSLLSGFPMKLDSTQKTFQPLTADVDNDGREEILVPTEKGIILFGFLQSDPQNYFPVSKGLNSHPSIEDLNGDGRYELLYITSDGYLYAQKLNTAKSTWRHFGGNPAHNPFHIYTEQSEAQTPFEIALFYVYPNPVHTPTLTLRFKAPSAGKGDGVIYNFSGQKMKTFSFNVAGGLIEEKTIYVGDLGPDIYTLKVDFHLKEGILSKKIRFVVGKME